MLIQLYQSCYHERTEENFTHVQYAHCILSNLHDPKEKCMCKDETVRHKQSDTNSQTQTSQTQTVRYKTVRHKQSDTNSQTQTVRYKQSDTNSQTQTVRHKQSDTNKSDTNSQTQKTANCTQPHISIKGRKLQIFEPAIKVRCRIVLYLGISMGHSTPGPWLWKALPNWSGGRQLGSQRRALALHLYPSHLGFTAVRPSPIPRSHAPLRLWTLQPVSLTACTLPF